MKIYKIGIFGIAHNHAKILMRDFLKFGDRVRFLGFTDYEPCFDLQERIKESLPNDFELPYYKNPYDLIALKPDIGIVCSDNALHAEVAVSLMENGIIPIIEKPMADNMDNAIRIYETSVKTGVEFIVNWPVAWFPAFNLAKKLLDEGAIGEPMRFIYRTTATLGPYSHSGPRRFNDYENNSWWYDSKRGGGALLDYCCYGSILACYFLNECPGVVYGHKRRFMMPDGVGDVEDYAQLTMHFRNTVGYAEGSWSTPAIGNNPTGPVIYGKEGTIVCDRYHPLVVKMFKKRYAEEPDQVYECPEGKETIATNLLSHLDNGTPLNPMILPKPNMWTMAILDAGIRSCNSGVPEKTVDYFK